jgi:hypothetical protein
LVGVAGAVVVVLLFRWSPFLRLFGGWGRGLCSGPTGFAALRTERMSWGMVPRAELREGAVGFHPPWRMALGPGPGLGHRFGRSVESTECTVSGSESGSGPEPGSRQDIVAELRSGSGLASGTLETASGLELGVDQPRETRRTASASGPGLRRASETLGGPSATVRPTPC